MELRQQRIADLARDILPALQARSTSVNRLYIASIAILAVLLVFIYVGNVYYRPISYSEALVLHTLIESKAQRQQLPVSEVRLLLLERFHILALEDLRASEWREAMSFLLQYRS